MIKITEQELFLFQKHAQITIHKISYYHDILEKISLIQPWKKITPTYLNIPSGILHKGYEGKKDDRFNGGIIEYFCSICLDEVIIQAIKTRGIYDNNNKKAIEWLKGYLSYSPFINNILRIFINNEEYLRLSCKKCCTNWDDVIDIFHDEIKKLLIEIFNNSPKFI